MEENTPTLADDGSLVPADSSTLPPWAFGRREAVAGAAILLGGSLTSLTESSLQVTDAFGPAISADVAAAMEHGDQVVRSLWLGRLAYPTLIVALETGMFEALKNGQLSREKLGSRMTPPIPGDGHVLEALTGVLSSLGLLHIGEDDGHVQLTEAARVVLLKDSPYFWGPQLLAADGVTASLRRALQQESSPRKRKTTAYDAHSTSVVDSFIDSMEAHSSVTADATARALGDVIGPSSRSPARQVLDMAGGSGCFAKALTKYHPNLKVTLADLPSVVARWRRKQRSWDNVLSSHRNHNRNIDAVPADLFDERTWPCSADVVLLANVLHDWGEGQVLDILKAARVALLADDDSSQTKSKERRVIIVEQLLNEDRSGPLPAALASVSMLLGDWRSGKQYTFTELERLCKRAGFRRVELGPKCGEFHRSVIATVTGD